MRVVAVASALAVLGLLDGALAGFRSSLGRRGAVEHRVRDRVAARRGLLLMGGLLLPVAVATGLHALAPGPWPAEAYVRAGTAMLAVYLPYAVVTLLALLGYLALGWRWGYLASAVILGPFTLVRPLVATAGVVAGAVRGDDGGVTVGCLLALGAVLAVEPLSGRLWWSAGQGVRSVASATQRQ
ncbi:hypothetical protein [uncultured Phycicoccus sp.]|uniref:hypothetical protein n=1 Tax=uncultured Phycicoccus sp. TaxID=661422 RepID=UPI0026392545|nr:hypothetical protein [uncultured Phycicoccus sp.]